MNQELSWNEKQELNQRLQAFVGKRISELYNAYPGLKYMVQHPGVIYNSILYQNTVYVYLEQDGVMIRSLRMS